MGEDHATDPTKAMVHALLKMLKTEPEDPESPPKQIVKSLHEK